MKLPFNQMQNVRIQGGDPPKTLSSRKTDTHVDMLYLAAVNSPASTYPMIADPTTAPPNAKAANSMNTSSANVSLDRRSFCFAGERACTLS